MSESQFLSKQEFLEVTANVLKEFLSPAALQKALLSAATQINVDAEVVNKAFAPPPVEKVEPSKKIEKEEVNEVKVEAKEAKPKRAGKISSYTLFVTWFLDYAGHYGHNPTIVSLKSADPTLGKVQLAAAFYKTVSEEKKKLIGETYSPFLNKYNEEHMSVAGGPKGDNKILEELAKYEKEHPSKSLETILGLKTSDSFKTDPAVMKAESAAAAQAAKAAQSNGEVKPAASASAPAAPVPAAATPATADASAKDSKKKKREDDKEGAAKKKEKKEEKEEKTEEKEEKEEKEEEKKDEKKGKKEREKKEKKEKKDKKE